MADFYTVKITLDPKDVTGVRVDSAALKGEFLFYKSGLTGHTDETGMVDCEEKFPPSQYEEGMASIGGIYYEELKRNAEGIYETVLTLPAGVYPYQFIINPELGEENKEYPWSNVVTKTGAKLGFPDLGKLLGSGFKSRINKWISDPKNPPVVPTVTGAQSNSELFVGTCRECARIPIGDPDRTGTVSFQSYTDADGNTQSAGVYLPAGYDRTKTYPLILVSHGGGGNEGDWFSQGNINHIMDNLIAQGRTKEAILVTPNNSVYDWDFEKIARNIETNLIPYIEKVYNVSKDPHDRAFCGLSMGSMTTLYMLYHRSGLYDYYGAFSGGLAPGHPAFSLDNPHIREVKLLIGCAEEDIAYNTREIGIPTTIAALKEAGVPYEPYFVTGSHDWFCWPEMFEYFAEQFLWK